MYVYDPPVRYRDLYLSMRRIECNPEWNENITEEEGFVRALKLEQEYTKDEILEAYLNVVNFGGSCQGVEAAATRYFDKSITDCSIAECAAIVGITQNPSAWDPFIYPDNNKYRHEIIINEMHSQGKITDEEYETAAAGLRAKLQHDEHTQLYTCTQFDAHALLLAENWVKEYCP